MEASKTSSYKRSAIFTLIAFIATSLFVLLTNPNRLPAFLLLVLPLLTFITSYSLMKLFMAVFTDLTIIRIKTLAGVVSFAPALVVILGSLGQLGLQDLMLALVLVTGLSWYLRRLQTE